MKTRMNYSMPVVCEKHRKSELFQLRIYHRKFYRGFCADCQKRVSGKRVKLSDKAIEAK